ncbi:PdxT/SNO family [Stachybotrys elegans]|uniref:glutaminase n=1 Tax=Stachybotrys elegans TaxID=80388 RepID=A0A8K0SMP5_9HYPO|nr:PdxT/SNO family [Stachybotrys elegans]
MTATALLTVGVLALQGGFYEHLTLLRAAAAHLADAESRPSVEYSFIEVRTPEQLAQCSALVIPGGESTTISLVAAASGLLEPLRHFVKVDKKPTWGTCAGLILLSDQVSATKKGGQELIGGLAVRVHRNHFGRQIESFNAPLSLPFLSGDDGAQTEAPYPGVFIRAPVVEEVLSTSSHDQQPVQILAKLPGRVNKMKEGMSQATTKDDAGDVIAVRQGNILGTSFHPELTTDLRMHVWWLRQIVAASNKQSS